MGKIRYCNVEVEDLCLDIGSELMAVFSSFYKPSSSLVVPKCSSSRHLLEANDRRILKVSEILYFVLTDKEYAQNVIRLPSS